MPRDLREELVGGAPLGKQHARRAGGERKEHVGAGRVAKEQLRYGDRDVASGDRPGSRARSNIVVLTKERCGCTTAFGRPVVPPLNSQIAASSRCGSNGANVTSAARRVARRARRPFRASRGDDGQMADAAPMQLPRRTDRSDPPLRTRRSLAYTRRSSASDRPARRGSPSRRRRRDEGSRTTPRRNRRRREARRSHAPRDGHRRRRAATHTALTVAPRRRSEKVRAPVRIAGRSPRPSAIRAVEQVRRKVEPDGNHTITISVKLSTIGCQLSALSYRHQQPGERPITDS